MKTNEKIVHDFFSIIICMPEVSFFNIDTLFPTEVMF